MNVKLPELMVSRGLAESVDKACRMIGAGEVYVDGQLVDHRGTLVAVDVKLRLKQKRKYVSRGGYKLEAALSGFGIEVDGWIAADIGASTGGFTDCLLQNGASKVYAIDVAYGELAWKLRQDARVKVIERTNARYLESLPEPVNLIVSDVSFIALSTIYQRAVNWFADMGDVQYVISLIKPQFEARADQVGDGGVVRDPAVHQQVLVDVIDSFSDLELHLQGLMVSPVMGPAGNIEFLGWWQYRGSRSADQQACIATALSQAAQLREENLRIKQ